jgi:hypothetical protein
MLCTNGYRGGGAALNWVGIHAFVQRQEIRALSVSAEIEATLENNCAFSSVVLMCGILRCQTCK